MSTTTLTFGAAVDSYVRDQQTFGRFKGVNTALRYRAVLRMHHEDVGARRGPLRTDREDVKRTLARWHGNSQYSAHSCLISFYDWLMQEGLRKENPARQVHRTKLQRPSVYRITRAEAAAMMDACVTVVDRRIIYIGLLTGARVGELAALQVRHLERPGWVWFSEDIAKGGTERWVPVLPELEPVIAETIENMPALAFVIPTRDQTRNWREGPRAPLPISRTMVNRRIKAIARRAGIAANIHAHLLRHSFGDHIAQYAGLRAAQALMGHSSVETTARVYTSRPGLDELAGSVRGFRYRGAAADTSTLVDEFAQLAERARAAGLDLATLTSGGE
jgi:integrase/recombinase XerC